MPPRDNWEPPYPSYSAVLPEETARVVMAYYAVQHDGAGPDAVQFSSWLQGLIAGPHGPAVANRAHHVTANGLKEDIFILYWLDPAVFEAFEAEARDWWLDPARLTGPAGYWRELWRPPLSHLETLISSETPAGLAEAQTAVRGPIREHAYWGAMRDRIPESARDPLAPALPVLPQAAAGGPGQRLRITPPGNLCLIRSGQNWTDCGPEELTLYDAEVRPVLRVGMDFLRDNGPETGCVSCRFMEERGLDGGTQQKSFGLACFLSLGHLEAWAKSHPTHLAIFQSFHRLVRKRDNKIDLKLWHEVSVMPEGCATAEYLNCDPATGFLPWLAGTDF